MIDYLHLTYFIILNILIFFNFERISKILNTYDLPNERKFHKTKTPLLGGFIIAINLLLFSILFLLGEFKDDNVLNFIFAKDFIFLIFFSSTILIFLIGLLDDKFNLNPNVKLFLLTIIISLTLWFDNSLLIQNLIFSFVDINLYLGKYSFVFTLMCILLFINACNMFDGINLQSTSYFIFVILYLIIIGLNNNVIYFLLIPLLLIFILNKDEKIFMGDSGIYLISFIMSYILIKIYNFDTKLSSDLIFILMMVPGIDMFRLFLLRLVNKKNPFSPDRNHIHHLLLKRYSYKKTIIILNLSILYPMILIMLNFEKLFIILIYIIQYILLIIFLEKNKTNL